MRRLFRRHDRGRGWNPKELQGVRPGVFRRMTTMPSEGEKCRNCAFVGAYLHSDMYECDRPQEDGAVEAYLDSQVLEHGSCDRWKPKEKPTEGMKCPKCRRIGQCCTCLNSEGCYHPQCSIFEAAESIADCVDEILDAHHFSCAFHYKKGV